MKTILFFVTILGFFYLKKIDSNTFKKKIQSEIKLNLPLGSIDINYQFEQKWRNGDTINYRPSINKNDIIISKLGNYYDSLFTSLKLDKKIIRSIKVNYFDNKKIVFNKNDEILKNDENFFIDSISYYCGTIYKDKNYQIQLYKDRGSYNSKIGGDLCVTNYLNLVCFDKNNNITDTLTILLKTLCITGPTERYFYIDKKLNIIIKDFDFNEDGYYYHIGNKKYKFNFKGKFIEI